MSSEEAAPSGRRFGKARVALAVLAILLCAGLGFAHPASAATNSSVVAGLNNILGGFSGDGGPATAAELNEPGGVAATPGGGFLIADAGNRVVRRVSPTGIITTVAGNGQYGSSGDGGPATAATLKDPLAVAATADGGYLIADASSARIRKVSPTGIITTVAGTGTFGSSGDGGPAAMAQLSAPSGVAATADGGFLIADLGNSRVRKVSPTGTITTVAGTGVPGFSGDGGPATAAQLGHDGPFGVAATPDGGFLIADDGNSRVRKVSPTGTITTVAGTGVRGFSGDGGPATAAQLNQPDGVAATPDGGVLIADFSGERVRRVSPAGTITTVAGDGTVHISADGGPATATEADPLGVAATASGGFLIADQAFNAVRFVDAHFVLDTTAPTVTAAPAPAFVANTNVAAGRVPVRISWAATDAGSGVSSYQLQESVNGGAFTNVPLPTATTTQLTRQEAPGTSYRYQVRATDAAGNTSTFRVGRLFTVRAFQESDPALAYSSGWTSTAQAGAFGGSVRTATAAGSTATFSLSGALAVAWVSTKDVSSGGAHVLLDNATTSAVNLNSASTLPGRLVYARSVSASTAHTVRVTVDGTTGHPKATVDAFVVIQ